MRLVLLVLCPNRIGRTTPFQWSIKIVRYTLFLCSLAHCRYGNANVWKTFTDLFDYFPLTALVRIAVLVYLGRFACVSCEFGIQFVSPFPRLSQKYFACMVDYHHLSKPSITSATSIVSKKFLMKVQCVIFCGLIQMIDVAGAYLLEVLDTLLARYLIYHIFSTYLVDCYQFCS